MEFVIKTAIYIILAIITIILGLLSRSTYSVILPSVIAEFSGDILWGTLVYFCICIIRPQWYLLNRALSSTIFAFTIELSQLYHAPWIDKIRHTTLGGLVLGFGYKASDLICYLLGIALGTSVSCLISYFFDSNDKTVTSYELLS